MTEISLIIPLYNKRAYIGRALESVLAQAGQGVEVIVVDDGSTDGGAGVVREYGRAGVRLVQQANCGPGAARNRGVRECSSNYIAFLDADDELLPGFLQRNVGNLNATPQCAVSVCASVRGPEKTIARSLGAEKVLAGAWRMRPTAHAREVHAATVSMHVSVVMRRKAFLALGGFYENRCTFAEDSYLWLQVLLNCLIYVEPKPLMWYHTEDGELNLHHTQAGSENWADLRRLRPIPPILSDPSPIRQSCPEDYRTVLERYLASEALAEALTRTSVGDEATARELQRLFPRMDQFRYDYTKLRIKLAHPRLVSLAGRTTALRRRAQGARQETEPRRA